MGKRWCAALLCALLVCSMTGCSDFLDREWYEVKDHSPTYYEGEGRDVLRADTYQDLVNNILILVGNHAESGTIWLYYAQEGLDAAEAAEKASREVEKDTPMGSYAVSYILLILLYFLFRQINYFHYFHCINYKNLAYVFLLSNITLLLFQFLHQDF